MCGGRNQKPVRRDRHEVVQESSKHSCVHGRDFRRPPSRCIVFSELRQHHRSGRQNKLRTNSTTSLSPNGNNQRDVTYQTTQPQWTYRQGTTSQWSNLYGVNRITNSGWGNDAISLRRVSDAVLFMVMIIYVSQQWTIRQLHRWRTVPQQTSRQWTDRQPYRWEAVPQWITIPQQPIQQWLIKKPYQSETIQQWTTQQSYQWGTVPQRTTQQPTFDYTVYITETGGKYHRWGCRYLRRSAVPINRSRAISLGYGPCSVCNP